MDNQTKDNFPSYCWLKICVHLSLVFCCLNLAAEETSPWNVYIATNNDFFANNKTTDDLYTFGLRIEASLDNRFLRFEENAFTDREAGFRFDETYLTTGFLVTPKKFADFCIWMEGGVAHVGKGLLGQRVQNSLHDLLGDRQIVLDYLPDTNDYHPHFRAEIGQQWHITDTLTWGPQTAFTITPGFRWNALAGLRTIWRPSTDLSMDLMVGNRFADTELDLLKNHMKVEALEVQIHFEFFQSFLIEWSLNRYGTEQQHVAIGYHFGKGQSPRRHGAWMQANAAP